MENVDFQWELTILDGLIPVNDAASLAIGDIDGDGVNEVVIGGDGALLWYRPDTLERGIIDKGMYSVGLALEDIDGDGIFEIFAGRTNGENRYDNSMLYCYKIGNSLHDEWSKISIAPDFSGYCHDIILADVDGDGEKELLTLDRPGIFIFKPGSDITQPWNKHIVIEDIFTEGLQVGDLDGDGKMEIICGPDWYKAPDNGPYSGSWKRSIYAPNFRESNRAALFDITGNGQLDIILLESEYMEGRLSWFENRMAECPENPWFEHIIDKKLTFGHSLSVWRDTDGLHIFAAEMEQGGWDAQYNYDARLIEYVTTDGGKKWDAKPISAGSGTHQALVFDIDGDGDMEIIGKTWSPYWKNPKLQLWKKSKTALTSMSCKHRFIDRDKPHTATDIITADIDGDGLQDIICGSWWYRNPNWERYEIPGVCQILNAYDIDGDGRNELIGIKKSDEAPDWYAELSSEVCWIKPVDPLNGKWEVYPIGTGSGDWPHGSLIGPLLPGGRIGLVLGYHSALRCPQHYPEIFEMPEDPKITKWNKRILAEIQYGEEMLACDLDGNGRLDIIAGCHILENMGDGSFKPHKIIDGLQPARLAVMDVNGDGKPDIVLGDGTVNYDTRTSSFLKLVWFENPGAPFSLPWKEHVIDTVRCPHSISAADLDGDGEMEIICGEHDPYTPYRNRSRLIVYKKADLEGNSWKCFVLDDRFEHHCGTKIFELGPGRTGIASHGWVDSIYVNLWEIS